MKKFLVGLFLCVFLMGLVVAQDNDSVQLNDTDDLEINDTDDDDDNKTDVDRSGRMKRNETRITIREKRNGEFKIDIREERDGERTRFRLRTDNISALTDLNITPEMIGNATRLKIRLSNGRNAEIKIMPSTASERALERLRLKVCSTENNCTIELKETGQGNDTRLTYEVQIERHSRILGIFKAKMRVRGDVDAETGEVVRVNKPWWAFLATEPEEE